MKLLKKKFKYIKENKFFTSKNLSFFLIALLISTTAIASSFTKKDIDSLPLNQTDEFEILLNYFETNNNFINTDTQLIIPANEVKKNMGNDKYHVVDIRTDTWYEYGHLKNANNVKAADLLTYFENKITPTNYDKIVLICYSGQSAAYYTSLLRLAGYGNVYSMKWGMSSWRLDFAENSWLKNVKNDFADKLETNETVKPEKGTHPTLNTGKTEAKEILRTRLEKAFATPYKEYIIKNTDVFANPNDYYIANYWDQDKYINGHIPNAIFYQSNTSLASNVDLFTLPTDKKIALYDATGQNTAHAVAYLNVLGYDVGNIAYGANSFMNKTIKDKDWNAFTKKQINMYPVIE